MTAMRETLTTAQGALWGITPLTGHRSGVEILKRSDMLGHRKLQIWTRLQLLAKWAPKKYGERTAMELTGANGGPVQISDAERAAKVAAILASAQARKDGDVSDLV